MNEIITVEKELDKPKLANLVFLLLQELKNSETPNFSEKNLLETNFLSIYRVMMSNKDYWSEEDLSNDLTWCFSILITNTELTFQFLMEQKVIDYLFFLMQKGKMKLQSMVINKNKKFIIELFPYSAATRSHICLTCTRKREIMLWSSGLLNIYARSTRMTMSRNFFLMIS